MTRGLLPQDVVVLVKLICSGNKSPAITQLAGDLRLSPSQIHVSLNVCSGLVSSRTPERTESRC